MNLDTQVHWLYAMVFFLVILNVAVGFMIWAHIESLERKFKRFSRRKRLP
ncbi:MAG: hypothetical protein HRU25_08000 [Psychrobium sp.]|nr:hypothetical protein [Psychrobium sp.]